MSLKHDFLKEDQFPQIYAAFMEAFADYYVDAGHITEEVLYNRMQKNAVDFESSIGVFADSKIVGFTLIGIDRWRGELCAFDAGTGIIPAYRGKGIAKQMFDFALPKLRDCGVRKFILEVLQVNEPAVKAYQKAGFRITREFDCFQSERRRVLVLRVARNPFAIKPVGKEILESFRGDLDWEPSWENSFASIQRIPGEVTILGAHHKTDCVGILVYSPMLNWIMCLLVRRQYRRKGVGSGLLFHFMRHLPSDTPSVRLINVDHGDKAMRAFLDKVGFEYLINQYEMERAL
jgi:ribosomal protein S18 acetylase RimI-like enzyme